MQTTFVQEKTRLEKIWRQRGVPVCYRRGKGQTLLVRLPYAPDNQTWLRAGRHRKPNWCLPPKEYWDLPASWFNDLVNRSLSRWGRLYIIQPYQYHEVCAPACWHADGHECECSCMGANHGSQSPSGQWFVVSDSFAVLWGERTLACRLIEKTQ